MSIYSLGGCCELTLHFEKKGILHYKKSYHTPFDYLSTPNPKKVIECFENDFKDIEHTEYESNIPYFKDLPYYSTTYLINKKYDIIIPHYSREEYKNLIVRRVERFRKILQSHGNIFIRKNHRENHISMSWEDCMELSKHIDTKNNILVVINENALDINGLNVNWKKEGNVILIETHGFHADCRAIYHTDLYWTYIENTLETLLK